MKYDHNLQKLLIGNTLGPPKFEPPISLPPPSPSEFWNFPNFGVYISLDRKIKCYKKKQKKLFKKNGPEKNFLYHFGP